MLLWYAYPEYRVRVPLVPAVAHMVREEAPGFAHISIWKQDTYSVAIFRISCIIVPPDEA